jgi:UDP-N-acetylglucosamine transferase subunit ALG13
MGRTKKALSKGHSSWGNIMIFVTVGTHEQQFDRLVKEIDSLKGTGIIKDEVFIQLGYSVYKPKYCSFEQLIDYDKMKEYSTVSDIIITHGGPGSIMLPLSLGKMPIVVPRQQQYGEHVDNHQVLFAKRLESEGKILGVYEIDSLKNYIVNYEKYTEKSNIKNVDNLSIFLKSLDQITKELFS